MQLKNKLMMMVGNTYMYKTRVHKIIATKIKGETVFVSTDIDLIELSISDAYKIIEEDFLPTDVKKATTDLTPILYDEIKNANLINDLRNNIEKVKRDPSYIPQALTINNTIKTLLDIVKTQIQIDKIS